MSAARLFLNKRRSRIDCKAVRSRVKTRHYVTAHLAPITIVRTAGFCLFDKSSPVMRTAVRVCVRGDECGDDDRY